MIRGHETERINDELHSVKFKRGEGKLANREGSGEKVEQSFIVCRYCGRKHERDKQKCPALGKRCLKCNKLNHFAAQCLTTKHRQSRVNQVQSDSKSEFDELATVDYVRISQVHAVSQECFSKKVFATLNIGNRPVKFQLDSGATCNVMPVKVLQKSVGSCKLQETDKILSMYNKSMVKPIGQCQLSVMNPKTGKSYKVDFVVIEASCVPLLGSSTVQEMHLIEVKYENIMAVNGKTKSVPVLTKESLVKEFPEVFARTGKFDGKYVLEIDPTAKPVVHPPRRVPVALKKQLKEELSRLERLGVLKEVTSPTSWVSSMVVVRKPKGSLRICIDPKDLNEVLKRSHYPIPTIDEVLAEITRARVFSTFDVRNGFWHVELDDESSFLTTFNTPFGRFRWLRLPFGLVSAPEEFQRRQQQVVEGLPGVISIHDDILVFGEGENDEEAVLDHNVKLNKEKVRFKGKEVPFIGHLLTDRGLKPDPEKVKAILEMPKPKDVLVCAPTGWVRELPRNFVYVERVCEPLRKLTVKDAEWTWLDTHDQACAKIKELVTKAPVLKYYEAE
ncbi:uncharacterized protein K02A2.6-like [Dendronephthya gigantea]|uniref:uncharacterized protein K02A2.6-like n=1 Tax=Dendronephthya gigantea TaxID=151771 RepID=UPI00106AED0C|nr:uncharacterized protein K02A2.6-like [Dendronephthya gigantea]